MKIAQVSLLLLACIFFTNCADKTRTAPVLDSPTGNTINPQNTQSADVTREYDTASIVADLTTKAKQFDSFAVDYVSGGQMLKRMSFLFRKDGKDFYCYRSDYIKDGKKYSRLFGVDGKYDYEYSPSDKAAIRRPTQMKWNSNNYSDAKNWHFDLEGYEVVGEKQLNGKDCYVLESKKNIITVWKQNGMWTSLTSKVGGNQPLIYDNFAFNLSEEEFTIPDGTEIREQGPE